MSNATKVWLMRPDSGGPWLICHHAADVVTMLDEADEGSAFVVKRAEMTDEEIRKAGEFDGW